MTTVHFDMQPRNIDDIKIECCKPRWISIKDRVPEHNQFVLAVGTAGNIVILRCDLSRDGDKVFDYVFMSPDLKHQVIGVTHWMPLPEKPYEMD